MHPCGQPSLLSCGQPACPPAQPALLRCWIPLATHSRMLFLLSLSLYQVIPIAIKQSIESPIFKKKCLFPTAPSLGLPLLQNSLDSHLSLSCSSRLVLSSAQSAVPTSLPWKNSGLRLQIQWSRLCPHFTGLQAASEVPGTAS